MLKLKKEPHESAWRGKISYLKTELQLQDPSQVEKEVLKGRRPRGSAGAALGAAPWPSWLLLRLLVIGPLPPRLFRVLGLLPRTPSPPLGSAPAERPIPVWATALQIIKADSEHGGLHVTDSKHSLSP